MKARQWKMIYERTGGSKNVFFQKNTENVMERQKNRKMKDLAFTRHWETISSSAEKGKWNPLGTQAEMKTRTLLYDRKDPTIKKSRGQQWLTSIQSLKFQTPSSNISNNSFIRSSNDEQEWKSNIANAGIRSNTCWYNDWGRKKLNQCINVVLLKCIIIVTLYVAHLP